MKNKRLREWGSHSRQHFPLTSQSLMYCWVRRKQIVYCLHAFCCFFLVLCFVCFSSTSSSFLFFNYNNNSSTHSTQHTTRHFSFDIKQLQQYTSLAVRQKFHRFPSLSSLLVKWKCVWSCACVYAVMSVVNAYRFSLLQPASCPHSSRTERNRVEEKRKKKKKINRFLSHLNGGENIFQCVTTIIVVFVDSGTTSSSHHRRLAIIP